jgi:hypothetical protein
MVGSCLRPRIVCNRDGSRDLEDGNKLFLRSRNLEPEAGRAAPLVMRAKLDLPGFARRLTTS